MNLNDKKNKNKLLVRIVVGILIVLYNIIVFAVPFAHTGLFWVSYGFTLLAFGLVYYSFCLSFGKNVKSRFYGYPIMRIGFLYGGIQLAISFILMLFSKVISVWIGIVLFSILLVLAVIGLIATEVVRSEIEISDDSLNYKIATMRNLQSITEKIQLDCKNPDVSECIKKVADELRYSDPVSSPRLEKIESDLVELVNEFQNAVYKNEVFSVKELSERILNLLRERNRLCVLYKHEQ